MGISSYLIQNQWFLKLVFLKFKYRQFLQSCIIFIRNYNNFDICILLDSTDFYFSVENCDLKIMFALFIFCESLIVFGVK